MCTVCVPFLGRERHTRPLSRITSRLNAKLFWTCKKVRECAGRATGESERVCRALLKLSEHKKKRSGLADTGERERLGCKRMQECCYSALFCFVVLLDALSDSLSNALSDALSNALSDALSDTLYWTLKFFTKAAGWTARNHKTEQRQFYLASPDAFAGRRSAKKNNRGGPNKRTVQLRGFESVFPRSQYWWIVRCNKSVWLQTFWD